MDRQALQIALMGPKTIDYTRRAAGRQFANAADASPVQHWTQGAARVLGGLGSSMRETQAAQSEQQAAALQKDALARALGGGSLEDAATMLMGNPATSDVGLQLAQTALGQRYAQPKIENVGGNLVKYGTDGNVKVLYSSPREASRPINVDGNLISVNPDGTPRFIYKKPPSLAERLMGGQGGSAQPSAPQGGVIQQSNPVAPGQDPNLQLTAGGPPQQAPAPRQDLVEIPGFPPMPRSKAEKLRSAFALEGNKAGVDLLDRALMPPESQIGEAGSNEVDKQLINSGNALTRLFEIQRQFKPEYQEYGTRVDMSFTDLMDRFGQADNIPPEKLREFEDYRKFRLSAIDNINRYIKEITGAQMSEAEATRLRQGAPDTGDNPLNPFSGDSPRTFKAKMDQTIRTMALAQMRFHYLKKNGFAGNGEQAESVMSLQKMEDTVEERTDELLQDATARGVPQQEALPMIKQQLQQEFGMSI